MEGTVTEKQDEAGTERKFTSEEAAANAARMLAEARKHDAEAAKMQAEASKAAAEAATALAEAEERRAKADREILEHQKWIEHNGEALGILLAKDRRFQSYPFNFKVCDSSVNDCIDMLNYWHRTKPECPMEIVFYSPGGEVMSGMRLFDHIRWLSSQGHYMTTVAMGYAASMGGVLLQAGDKRVMGRECPAPETPVLMADLSYKRAGDLEVGDAILSLEEGVSHYRSWQSAVVRAVGRAHRPCSLVRLSDGSEFMASENHGWLTKGSYRDRTWTRTKHLNVHGAGASRVKRLLAETKPLPTWDAGWMAGILDGEGCLHGKRGGQSLRIDVVQADGLILDEIKTWLELHDFKTYVHRKEPTEVHKGRESICVLGGLEETLRLLALTRPKRLLQKLPDAIDGMRLTGSWVPVESVTPVGMGEVVSLATSSATFIGGGVAQHNSYVLIHEISFGAGGSIGEVEDEVEFAKKIQGRIVNIFCDRAKGTGRRGYLTPVVMKRKWKRKDWWVDSDEAWRLGIVDEISAGNGQP